ncbi:ATP-binding protein [Nitratiruptor sp. YY09-18]|uniref:ATP-binding protein n=1 Tax=Nitratiruptor sp. YY09-18 TaxID=2724901 RepID=UPI001915F903|nr:DUF87 domain-containing protein [Nitratiruptor sp. YY09-18]BCD67523.1 hypothetical protein NitYY0918_C0418 [Nitratiruptor sp. YY09-18]
MTQIYEKLGLFYLGKQVDQKGEETGLLELIKNKHLTTHAAIIGMTGSGKTGLGIGILEEAAIDKIPALIIDPKGDMGDLLLAFENLSPQEFVPWIDPLEAQKKGLSVEEYADKIAAMWQEGIESFYQDRSRIKKLKESADFTIYTPGSSAGVQISLLASFDAPSKEIIEDTDSYSYMLAASANSLLALLGQSQEEATNEFILLSNILDFYWKKGESLTLEQLIANIINPPFKKIGILPLEGFYPANGRTKLALKLNNLISHPSFSNWIKGEPLDIAKLLYTQNGKPRMSIMYIAHLSDNERMFFVTYLLNKLISWMRTQSGTSALRALLYMDEIFGYFPPNANPPSKEPMLLLLKQARAFGIGAVLSTQNPVDIDYKGLANIGTWFLGRLQTKQDIERVIDGLLKNSPDALDKKRITQILSNLPKRTFLLRSIHKENLEIFKTRWVLSYLKGPLNKEEIARLMAAKKEEKNSAQTAQNTLKPKSSLAQKPLVPAGIDEYFEIYNPSTQTFRFAPFIQAKATLHYYNQTRGIDTLQEVCYEFAAQDMDLEAMEECDERSLATKPPENSVFAALPSQLLSKKGWVTLAKDLRNMLYINKHLTLYKIAKLRIESTPEESLEDFKARALALLRDKKEQEREKIQKRYEKKLKQLQIKLRRAYEKLEKEKEEAKSKTTDTIISIGMTLLDSLFGRKKIKSSTIAKAGSTISKAKRAYNEYDDIESAKERIEELEHEIETIQEELEEELEKLENRYTFENFPIQEIIIKPRKSEIKTRLSLVWKQIDL